MTAPGPHGPASPSQPSSSWPGRRPSVLDRLRPRSLPVALVEAGAVGLLAAAAWAVLKGILEFPGVLVVAVIGGWAMGVVLWIVRARAILAVAMAAAAWLLGLVLTWLVSMAILPGSSRTFPERVASTPFVEWLAPQFGAIELFGLVLYVGAALYGARARR